MATGGGWGACDEGGGVIEDGGGGGEVYFDRSRAAEEVDSVPESQDSSAPEAMRLRILMRYTLEGSLDCCGRSDGQDDVCLLWQGYAPDAVASRKVVG